MTFHLIHTKSIRFRLVVWYFVAFALSWCLLAASLWLAMRKAAIEAVHEELAARRGAVSRLLDETIPHGDLNALVRELDHLMKAAGTGGQILKAVQVCDSDGRRIYRSESAHRQIRCSPLAKKSNGTPHPEPRFDLIGSSKSLGVLTSVVLVEDEPYIVQTAGRLNILFRPLANYRRILFVSVPLVFLLSSLVGYWMSRRALAPVDEIIGAARSIGAQNLSQRLVARGTDDELQRLTETMNEMFERLESAFQQVDSAYKQLDSVHKKVTQFTADASHELRTPVAVMRAAAEISLQKALSNDEYREVLSLVLAELERMSRLIEDLMTLTRVDAGSQTLEGSPIDLTLSVRRACREGQMLAAAKQISFNTRVPDYGIAVQGDPDAIRRLFLILIDNAVKYTPSGGQIAVSIEAHNGYAEGRIQDTGIGISPHDLPNIFERFYRADKARTRKAGGYGLGLPIARWIAEVHQGAIDVESIPGRGSTFSVKFPILRD